MSNQNIEEHLPPVLLPLPEFDLDAGKAVTVSIGNLPAHIATRLKKDLNLGAVDADLNNVLAAYGATFDASACLNAASGSNLLNSGAMTKLLVSISNEITDRDTIIELSPLLNDISKTLVKVNDAQVRARVAVARANTENQAVRGKVRAHPTSFAPGQQITLPEPAA